MCDVLFLQEDVCSLVLRVAIGFTVIVFFFFFKQKTAYEMRISDWSSDVCSSDLRTGEMWAVRDYFQVETTSGERFWLFRRGDGVESITGDLSWYIHGVFG